jgi:hypothetical protein
MVHPLSEDVDSFTFELGPDDPVLIGRAMIEMVDAAPVFYPAEDRMVAVVAARPYGRGMVVFRPRGVDRDRPGGSRFLLNLKLFSQRRPAEDGPRLRGSGRAELQRAAAR